MILHWNGQLSSRIWKGCAVSMAPSTALSGQSKGKLEQTPQLSKAFKAIKQIILENAPPAFPDPNIPHDICADALDHQLGTAIKQHSDTIAFHSRKPSTAQLKCPTVDKEMLCAVEVLKEHRSIPWGAKVNVHTDHVDLTCSTIASN